MMRSRNMQKCLWGLIRLVPLGLTVHFLSPHNEAPSHTSHASRFFFSSGTLVHLHICSQTFWQVLPPPSSLLHRHQRDRWDQSWGSVLEEAVLEEASSSLPEHELQSVGEIEMGKAQSSMRQTLCCNNSNSYQDRDIVIWFNTMKLSLLGYCLLTDI